MSIEIKAPNQKAVAGWGSYFSMKMNPRRFAGVSHMLIQILFSEEEKKDSFRKERV